MAEFDPTTPKDATEAAYAQALLGDDAGREQRRARLMAALPRPDAVEALPVAPAELAWRWRPYALGLLATGLLLAAVLALRGRPVEPRQATDSRVAAGPPASAAAVVLADASPAVAPVPATVAAAKASPPKPRAARPAPVVVADATPPRSFAAPAESVTAAAPAEPKILAESTAQHQADVSARSDGVSSGLAARARSAPQAAQRLAASDAARSLSAVAAANAALMAAITNADPVAARSALQAGASAQLRDVRGRTVLMLAARNGGREMVDLLLAAGARKADRDPQGGTAADHAESLGHGDLAERLR
jgi:hypothetical protein